MPSLENSPLGRKIIDITVPLSPHTRIFPGDPDFSVEKVYNLENQGCAVSRLSFGSHTGTHVDAPSHLLKNGSGVDKLELEGLMGEALVLDLSYVNGPITAETLKTELDTAAVFRSAEILLLKTAEEGLEGSAYLDESGAALVVERGFRAIGIDNFSVDCPASEKLPAHRILLSKRINIIECLDLGLVEAGIYGFICLPLKIEGCDGAPARAVLFQK